jgi:uncharacterized membrane protein
VTVAEIGPVQLIAFGFGPQTTFEGRIMDELAQLEEQATIRILDLLFVLKDADTQELVALDYQGEDLGAIVGALLGFRFEDDGDRPAADAEAETHALGLSAEQIEAMAGSLDPGSSAAFLLIEHVWARSLERAIRETGGVPIGEGFLSLEAIALVAPELGAMAKALDELRAEAGASASNDPEESPMGLGGGGGGLAAARAGMRVRSGQQYRTMARMERRRSAV